MIESIVTFKWKPRQGYRSLFTSAHVNLSHNAFKRNYRRPHRFICITDDADGIDPDIEVVPLWDTFSKVPNPTWPTGPSCYRRLLTFGKDFRNIAGDRFVCVDLDIVVTNCVEELFDREEDFVIWGTGNPNIPYCASMYMMTAGAKQEVLDSFHPCRSPRLSSKAGFRGSDQAWINYCLGKEIPTWDKRHGVYSYRDHIMKGYRGLLPNNARVVIFHGKPDPWDHAVSIRSPWVRDHLK